MRTKRLLTSTKTTSPTHKSSTPTIIKKSGKRKIAKSKRRVDDEDDEEGNEDMVEKTTNEMSRSELKDLIYRLKDRCEEDDRQVKKLKVELNLMKSKGRNTKQKIRSDFCWDGEEANLADKISNWVKTFLFPRYKFLKSGWMHYSDDQVSLSAFVLRKNQPSIPSSGDYEDL
jgi:hypothetical protein